jgi:methylglutaconyl-CoA hydratase
VLTLDEPDNRNALSATLLDGLGDGLERAMGDADVRLVVLTNTGTTFCAGADLRGGGEPRWSPTAVYEAILDAPKPVVGRVGGHCMGGGLGLAAACDVSIVAEDARMGFTEVRLGVAPAIISVIVVPKMRAVDAAELMLTGRRFSGREAADLGLLTRAAASDALDGSVAEVVEQLLAGGPGAQASIKGMLRDLPGISRDRAFAEMTRRSQALFASEEAREGIAAFRERRPAAWVPAGRGRTEEA